jgi:predicted esterase
MKPKFFTACAFLIGLTLAAHALAAQPTTTPDQLQTPGDHRLFLKARIGDADRQVPCSVYLPPEYGRDPAKHWPMVVFLVGLGETGDDHAAIYVHGPVAELTRNKELAAKADYIVLTPQCPSGLRWDSPGAAAMVLQAIKFVQANWRVDADRVYLTGLSMGGVGSYLVALEAKGELAAIAPISALAVQPDKVAAACRGTTTVWIIFGDTDGTFTEGSRAMADALRKLKVDTVVTSIPGAGHNIWANFYASRLFYDFLLLHRRGSPPPANRPTPEQLLAIAYLDPKSVDAQLAEPFKKFLPYWQLLNCGKDGEPGLRPDLAGRKNVFVTSPLDQAIPCRMITTVDVPANMVTRLELTVGVRPGAPWELDVQGNGESLLRKQIAAATPTPQPAKPGDVAWQDVAVDLSRFAGQSVRVQVLGGMSETKAGAANTPGPCSPAYWGTIAVHIEEPPRSALESVGHWVRQGGWTTWLLLGGSAAAVIALVVALRVFNRRSRRRGQSSAPSQMR